MVDEVAFFICSECGDSFEVKNYHFQTTEELIKAIEKAFSGVVLGNDIGLLEAQAIDDYETEEIQKEQREKDEKVNWGLLAYDTLQSCHSSLSFFDADGMRFHLPAYIIGSIKGKVDDPIFHLMHLYDYAESKLKTLTNDQIQVVIEYLNWCLTEANINLNAKKL